MIKRRRRRLLRECVPTFWKAGGSILLVAYPLVAVVLFIVWTLRQMEFNWALLAVLVPGIPILYVIREWGIRRAMEKELAWAGELPFPLTNYLQWISLERRLIHVRFADPPERALVADAISSAVPDAEIHWAGKSVLKVEIPRKYLYGSPETHMEYCGNLPAVHAFVDVLRLVARQHRVDRVECVKKGSRLSMTPQ